MKDGTLPPAGPLTLTTQFSVQFLSPPLLGIHYTITQPPLLQAELWEIRSVSEQI